MEIKFDLPSLIEIFNISQKIYFPLKNFMYKDEFELVLKKSITKDGYFWPIPIFLPVSKKIEKENEIEVLDEKGNKVAILKDLEFYSFNKKEYCKKVFGTLNKEHPGVKEILEKVNFCLGCKVKVMNKIEIPFKNFFINPKKTKKIFKKKGWKTIAAFQTRNVPHIGHEYLQKKALEFVDGLFINPVIGEKKIGDFKDEYMIASYEILLDRYLPKEKIVFGILPYNMKYAGPKEALLHAIIRKNFGCTHFIVGRDHAGVKNFYKPYQAQKILEKYKEEIGIELLKFKEVVYCKLCKKHLIENECKHKSKERFSGSLIRDMISKNKVNFNFIRPEIYFLVSQYGNSFVDNLYKKYNEKGFVIWFTGLPRSGKTTLANLLKEKLERKGFRVERLDGDIVRESLSKDLGFSKEERIENLRRVGSVANLLKEKGFIVLASFVSPYEVIRKELRRKIKDFIEIYCKCSLDVCIKRDKDGLYKKAIEGKIKNFTGISDVYEKPKNCELVLETDKKSIKACLKEIEEFLKRKIKW